MIISSNLFFVFLNSLFVLSVSSQTTTNLGNDTSSTGINNSFFGSNAGRYSTGNDNVAIGYLSGRDTQNGVENTFISGEAGGQNNGSQNVFIGFAAGFVGELGSRNTILGFGAGRYNQGDDNTAHDKLE